MACLQLTSAPRLVWVFLLVFWTATSLFGQQGTNTDIVGDVLSRDDGKPLRGAILTLTPVDSSQQRTATTDERGHFEFVKVPSARYSLRASAPGFIPAEWGSEIEGHGGHQLVVRDGQESQRVRLLLYRGGVITGRVVDEMGDPIDGVRVYALSSQFVAGKERVLPITPVARTTDDLGRYRLFGLLPGEYYVVACPGPVGADLHAHNQFPGYVSTFGPHAIDLAEAVKIRVSRAQDVNAGDISLVPSKTYTVSGTFLDQSGQAVAGVELVLIPGHDAAIGMAARQMTSRNGIFTFTNVPPGAYVLQNLPRPERNIGFTSRRLTVAQDEDSVMLHGHPAAQVTGDITFEEGGPGNLKPADVDIRPTAVDYTRSPIARGSSVRMRETWTFEMINTWGPHTLDVKLPRGWALRAVHMGLEDNTYTPIDFDKVSPSEHLHVVLTNRTTEINGTVTDEQGRPAADYPVIAFAGDPAKWYLQSATLQKTKTDENGRFTVSGLPPGDGLVIALDETPEDDEWMRPAYIESLRVQATPVTLVGGQPVTLTLHPKTATASQ